MQRYIPNIILFIFFTLKCLQGQPSANDQILSIENGLSQNLVYCIYQDHNGFLWFGTKDGLNKYDGYEFKIYRHEPGNNFSLSNNDIRAIAEDKEGNLWIGTFGGGLNKFDPVTEKFTAYRFHKGDSSTISSDLITGLVFERNKNNPVIWISTINGLNRFQINKNTCDQFFPDQYSDSGIKNNYVRCLIEDKEGRVWIGIMSGGLYYFDYPDKKFVTPLYKKNSETPVITCLTIDEKGTLFAGSHNAIFYFNDADQTLHKIPGNNNSFQVIKSILSLNNKILFSNFTTPGLLFQYDLESDSLSVFDDISSIFAGTHSGRIISLLKDRSGNMWMGTNGNGIVRKYTSAKKFNNYLFNSAGKNKLSFSSVSSIFEDEQKKLWISGYGGFDKLNTATGKISKVKFVSSGSNSAGNLPSLAIFKINYSPKSKKILWLSDESSGIIAYNISNHKYKRIEGSNFRSDKSFYGKIVYDMKYDKKGNLWIFTDKGLNEYVVSTGRYKHYYFFKDHNKFPQVFTNNLLIDLPTGIWAATNGAGFALINPSSGSVTRYVNIPDDSNSVSSNSIKCIFKDSKGIIWIGTNGGGLNKFSFKKNKFTRFTTKDGLPNNVVYGILEDNEGKLWLSTNCGLSKFDPDNRTFENYNYDDGLQSNEFNTGAYLKTSNGRLFFGGIKGVTSFYPDEITNSKFNPPVVITKFLLSNKPMIISRFLSSAGNLKLSYKENIFAFQFASLDYGNPEKNKYAYRLKGFSDKWIYTNAVQRTATFTNIDPGSYAFQVKGTNSDGVWSDKILSLNILIVPPFWGTLWFKIATSLLLVSLIYLLYRRRIIFLEDQKIKKEKFTQQLIESQENERTRIAKELHDAVGQDLLIIKNLSALAIQNKNETARNNYLNDISGKSQNTINEIRQISRNLRPYLIDRLGLTKAIEAMIDDLDKSNNIVFHFHSSNIDGCINNRDEIQLYRIIQELVNNIIKHSRASEAVITILPNENSLLITVKDDGVGIEGYEKSLSSQFGFGLSGIMERVRILKGKIDIQSYPDSGTKIFITIPVKNEK